jgi:uncharacterized protein (DUF2384 family)
MSDAASRVARVKESAQQVMGDRASAWMIAPNRQLSRLTPQQLAETSHGGMQIVLTELERSEVALRTVARRRR